MKKLQENARIIGNILARTSIPVSVKKDMFHANFLPSCENGHTLKEDDFQRKVSRCPDCGEEIKY